MTVKHPIMNTLMMFRSVITLCDLQGEEIFDQFIIVLSRQPRNDWDTVLMEFFTLPAGTVGHMHNSWTGPYWKNDDIFWEMSEKNGLRNTQTASTREIQFIGSAIEDGINPTEEVQEHKVQFDKNLCNVRHLPGTRAHPDENRKKWYFAAKCSTQQDIVIWQNQTF